MEIVVINQKMSNSGSIHDIASEHYDITIWWEDNTKYVIFCTSYHNPFQSQQTTAYGAIKVHNMIKGYGFEHKIIDKDQNHYEVVGNDLCLCDV